MSQCFLLFALASTSVFAQIQNEVQTTVLFDGTTGFLATDPAAPTGVAPEPHTAGEDGSPNNLVVRTHDQFAVRVDWNINERDATNVVLRIELPTPPDDPIAEWTVDSTLGYAGCITTTFTPAFTTVGGGSTGSQTVECELGDQPEGSNGTIRLTALLNESTDNTTFDVVSTLTTTEDPSPGVSDGLDQLLTVSAIPIATFRKGVADVAGDPSTGPITSGGEDGILFLYPLSLIDFSQGPNPIIGAGPIGSGDIDFFDHAYRLTDNVTLATQQQMDDAGFVGRTPCGPYDGAGAFPLTPSATWTCGAVTSPNGYPVVPINVTGLVANPAPATNADGSPNVVGQGVSVLSGQIAFWLPADEVQDEIDDTNNDSALSARFENAIAAQDASVEITDQADVLPIGVPDTSGGTVPELASTSDPGDDPSENTSRTILGAAPPPSGGPGASIGHHIIFRGGPLQILETELYNGGPRFGLDYRTVANGGLRGLLPGEQVAPANTNGDSIGDTPRGNIVTINSQVLALSTSAANIWDAPIQGCTAFDTTHYNLVAFGDIPITQTDGTGANTNPTVTGGTTVQSNTGPLAHVYTGAARSLQSALGGQQNAVGGFLAGLDYTVEFTDAPLEILTGGANFGVNNDELTCNDDDAGPSGWVDATNAAGLAVFNTDGDPTTFDGITRARVRITQRFPWAEGPDGAQDFYKGFQAFFQAMVKTDLGVQTVNQELFALQSHSFGDLGANGVPDLVPFVGSTLAVNCRPYSQAQWQATGNDLVSTTGYCNNEFIDDGTDPLDDTDLVDWDNNSATRFSTNATSGVTTFLNASGAVITIVEANLGLSKENRDGLADIADNGDIVEFILRPRVVGSTLEALTNVRLTDNLPANYEFVQFTQPPSSPGATCSPPPTPSGTITCQFSEPNPLVDSDPLLPEGIPGGWSDEVRFEVMVVGAIADPDTPTVITNTARISSDALGPWDPVNGVFSNPSAIAPGARTVTNSARSFLPLPADEAVIVKAVADLDGECEVVPPTFTGTLAEWQERCSVIDPNNDIVFDLTVENEGNTAFAQLEFIDVLPHLADATEEVSDTSVAQLESSRPPTVGDGRLPASNFNGLVSFVSLTATTLPTGASLAEVWVTADPPLTVSRDPNLALVATTWCDGVSGPVISGPAGACPAAPEDVTAVYGLIDGGAGLLPGDMAVLELTLGTEGTQCDDLWTNTFGLRMDEILLPIRSNDVSVMAGGCDLADVSDTYLTLIASGGPVHPVRTGLSLGATVDIELDGQPLATADGDDTSILGATTVPDDEDALLNVAGTAMVDGQTISVADVNGVPTTAFTLTDISVVNTTGNPAYVAGFIDFNGNGVFDPGEVSASVPVSASGVISLSFTGITGIVTGIVPLRLRLSSVEADVLVPGGFATDGEVEDHLIEILPVVQTAKVVIPANSGDTFDLTAGPQTASNAGNGDATSFTPFNPGAVSPIGISESSNSAYTTTAVCTDGNGVVVSDPSIASGVTTFDTSSITLVGNSAAANTISCTFTNTELTTIAVVKTATPADDTNFLFSSSAPLIGATAADGEIPASFELDGELVDSDGDNLINQISVQGDFSAVGDVTFTETVPPGWLLRSVSCDDVDSAGNAVTVVGAVPSVTVSIDPGDTITCAFDNIQLVSLGSELWIDANADGVIDANEPPVVGAIVNLLDSSGNPVLDAAGVPITTITDANGNYFFNDLLPGDYMVQVVVPPELVPTPVQNAGPNDDVNNDSNIDVASPLNNPAGGIYTSAVISLSPGTEPAGELDANGAADQPGQTAIEDDAGNMTLDFGFIPEPEIGVAKAAGVPTLNPNGTFDVVYTLIVENTGMVDISDITLMDDLASQFTPAFYTASAATDQTGGIVVAPAVVVAVDAPGTAVVLPTGNAAYTGDAAGIDLFDATPSTLGVGDSVEVTFTVRFPPSVAGQTLNNQATAGGADPSGRLAEDLSDDGSDALSNAGGPGTPTPVVFPLIEPSIVLAKEVAAPPVDLGNGSWEVMFNFSVMNDGVVDVTDLQIQDDLLAALNNPTPNGAVVNSASVAFVSGTPLTPNAAFDGVGNIDMLSGTDPFPVGASSDIVITMVFTPDSHLGPYNNNATASGTDPSGNPVVDDSENAAAPTAGGDLSSDTIFSILVPTVPISLGSFTTGLENDVLVFSWVTQSEVANIGFQLYGLVDDEWVQLNDSIIPSQGDSTSLQSYEYRVVTDSRVFSISDIDLQGVETLHGPFVFGETHGEIGERQEIDWQAEQLEREAKAAARKARLEERQRQRIQQQMQQQMQQIKEGDTSMFNKVKQSLSHALAATLMAVVPAAHAQDAVEWVNLVTVEEGMHEVSYTDISAAFGADLAGLDASQISLVNQGQTVPVQVIGGNVFGPGSSLRFVAKAIDTLYTNENVYTLRSGGAVNKIIEQDTPISSRAPFATSYLSSAKYAPQANYSFTSPDGDDPWYASRLVAVNAPASDTVLLQLDNVAVGGNNGSTQAKMNVNVWGASDLPGVNDHRMQIAFNGQTLVDETFNALNEKNFDMTLESVVEGNNRVTLTLPTQSNFGIDVVNVNEVEVLYPRQFIAQDNRLSFSSRFTKFLVRGFTPNAENANGDADLDFTVLREDANGNVVQVTNAQAICTQECSVVFGGTGQVETYYVSANKHVATPSALVESRNIDSGNATYLIISHPDFIGVDGNNQLEALAGELASEMGSADVVSVEQIYAQYSGHVFDPTAIQRYIQDAYNKRGTRYVLLVGGDVYDYRQFENEDATSFIPSLYASTGNNVTFAPVDAKYVDLDDDNVPDIPIGRLPVRTTAQLTSLMNKRVSYLARDYAGTALVVADEFDEIQQYDFADDANQVVNEFLGGFQVSTVFADDLGSRGARTALTNQINQGVTLTSFFGHSSTNQWSFDGLLTGNDAANLNNQGRPTVVTQWGCWNAYYVSPNEDSMGHRFLMEGDQGAVAVMGATTLTNANAESQLARLVFARLANGERLGDAVTGAKQEYAQTNPNDLDVLLGWTLLGMPDLFIN